MVLSASPAALSLKSACSIHHVRHTFIYLSVGGMVEYCYHWQAVRSLIPGEH